MTCLDLDFQEYFALKPGVKRGQRAKTEEMACSLILSILIRKHSGQLVI